jgi:LuxR family maltose regulon positive regulatory protein
MTTPLLTTKLNIPLSRSNWVPRQRLVERLNDGLRRKLTLISAPAGFGKTTLISDLKSQIPNLKMAWLSLDDDDNDPARFWAYVTAALQTLQSSIDTEALAVLHAGWSQSSPPKAFLTSLINGLVGLAADGVLVLDDYHVIESRTIHDSMVYLLEHLPPHLHIIIASRTDPPWPLARLRARDQLVEVRAADLRFTPEEAATFLNQVMGLGLTPDDLAALEARTEGWIAGLQLAAIALQAYLPQVSPSVRGRSDVSGFVAAFTGSNRYVLDYLIEEVLRRQTEEVQTFLLQTCILDRLCGPLCDAVTGRSDSQAILTMLEQANLFTTPLDEERRWYRYHHLFAEFLHSRLEYTLRDRIPALHRRAAEWYEQNGLADEAVPHALASQDWEHAARLVEQVSQALLMRGEMHTLQGWLQSLPGDLVRSRPRLSVLMAWLHVWNLALDAAEGCLRDAGQALAVGQALDAKEHASLESEIDAIHSVVYVFRGDMRRAAELAREALEHSAEGSWFLRSVVALDTSLSHAMNGDAQTANQALAEAVQFSQRAHNVMFAVLSLAQLAEQHIAQGHLHQAAALYRQAIQLAEEQSTSPPPVTSTAYSGLGEVLREWNQLDEATRYLNKSIELGLQWNEAVTLDGYISLARVLQAQGNAEAALAATHKVGEVVRKFDFSSLGDETFSAYQVRMWIVQGNLEAVAQWVQACESAVHKHWNEASYPYLFHEFVQLALVHAHLALNAPEKALAWIEQLAPEADARGRKGIVIEMTMLKALALQAMGDMAQATTVLAQALSWAEPEGYIRLFVDKGEPMRLLISDFRLRIEKHPQGESKKLIEYTDKLLSAFPSIAAVTQSEIRNRQSEMALSERELEVLRMIAAGDSNQEIATKLVVAPSTVKTHINNLYNKLGVNSRTQAVARAHELKLL